MKRCEYCDWEVKSFGTEKIMEDAMEPTARLTFYGGDLILLGMDRNPHFTVRYCPMCGRKVTKAEMER